MNFHEIPEEINVIYATFPYRANEKPPENWKTNTTQPNVYTQKCDNPTINDLCVERFMNKTNKKKKKKSFNGFF